MHETYMSVTDVETGRRLGNIGYFDDRFYVNVERDNKTFAPFEQGFDSSHDARDAIIKYHRRMKLADALESGDYKQGKHRLKGYGRHCVAGVACDVSGIGNWQAGQMGYNEHYNIGGILDSFAMSDLVRIWYGFEKTFVDTLMRKNDREDVSFDKLAKLIREY